MRTLQWRLVADDRVKPGDLLSIAAGGMPIYRVVAVEGDRAIFQRDGQPGVQSMPLERLYWRATSTA